MIKRILFTLFLLSLIVPATQGQQLKKMSFVPHWGPQSQFAGYYIARDKGFYKKRGIDLTIITGGPQVSSSTMLKNGEVDFASVWLTNAIQLVDRGTDIVNIAQLINRSALMLITKKSSGINKPEDMQGKKIGLWGGDYSIVPIAFLNKYNLNAITVRQGNSINLFFFDGIDVTSAMWYNEYHTIINSGYDPDELNTFFFADYGLNFPEDGIYCSGELYRSNPEICYAFIAATLEGWNYAFACPEESAEIMVKHLRDVGLPANKAHQKWMLARMKDLIFSSKDMTNFEKLSEQSYEFVCEKLKEVKLLTDTPPFNTFYKPIIIRKGK